MNRQPQLTDEEYVRLRNLIQERTGLLFGPRQREALARGVLAAARRADCDGLEEYNGLLKATQTDSGLWDDLIGAITVGETYFFRNPAHFDALRRHVLPELIARHGDDRRLRIWSAACATGEEPYSVAILLRQLLPDIARWNILVLGTDINKRVLEQAREGRYRPWSFRQTEPAIQERYFIHQDDLFEIRPEVQEMVTFAYLNLMEGVYPSLATNTNAMDLILCRNVAIYLPEAVMREIAGRFHRCLLPGGWLIVGASETNLSTYSRFAARHLDGATIYQKAESPEEAERGRSRGRETWEPRQALPSPTPQVTLPLRRPVTPSPRPSVLPLPCPEPVPPPEAKAPSEVYQEALGLLEQGHDEEAGRRLRACLESRPDFAPAHYQMARILANQGKLEEAQSWCEQALERDPLLVEAHYTLALICQETGALDEAVAQLKKTLYLDPDFTLAHFSLANLYQQMGRPEQAGRHRAQAIRLAAKMPPDDVVPGSDGLTAARLLTMIQATLADIV
jgi:chemotaxis protein methyltransferase CheR